MTRLGWLLVSVHSMTLGVASVVAQRTHDTPALTLEPYTLKLFDGREVAAELGRLTVPETTGSERTLRIAFLRLKTRAAQAGPPIVFLMGSGGRGIVMGQIPVFYRLFDRLRDVADVLLLDQRGVGLAEPDLESVCDARAPVTADALVSSQRAAEAQLAAVRLCAEQFRRKDVDPSAYTVPARADDLDRLRRALSAERLSLLAWSAGTEVALEAVGRYPDKVQTAVLAGTVAPDTTLSLPSTADLQLRKVSALVKASDAFKSWPDLFSTVQELISRLRRSPAKMTVTDRSTGRPVEIIVGSVALQRAIQGELSDGRSLPRLPGWLYELSRGDERAFGQKVEGMYNGLGSSSIIGLALGCERGWSRERLLRVDREAREAVVGTDASPLPQACAALGYPAREEARPAVFSSVRTLFVSGELDAATPPFQAEEVRFGFPRGAHLVVKNATHDAIALSPVQDAIVGFFKGEDAAGVISAPPIEFVAAASPPR